jgi:hypothetical protein
MSSFDFDYELIFTDNFDQTIINNSEVPDKSEAFTSAVLEECSKISTILNIYPGVNAMSSMLTYGDKVYKVTMKKL